MSESRDIDFTLFTILLTMVFISLKVTGYIHWSWLWVLSPLWISFALAITFIATLLTALFVSKITTKRKIKRKYKLEKKRRLS